MASSSALETLIELATTESDEAAKRLGQAIRACEDTEQKLALLLQLVDQRDGHWLALKVEEAKIALSDQDAVVLELERLAGKPQVPLSRGGFNAAIGHLVGGIETTVAKLLRDAGVNAAQIDTVFFTGGSSGVRLLRETIGALLPAARRVEGDLFGSIGAGLALDAQRRFA
ncbi:hypothetical protein E4K72_05035 [Oxalobacteraceae bacterium OM1]|nr:hypothetical protein E4K72_05035 [Oxalobacteraceae bacterium OM1]